MVGHFIFPVVHVDGRVRTDTRLGDQLHHLSRRDPKAWGQAGRPLENGIVGRRAVQRHQAAHGGTRENGVSPVGQGAEMLVDVGLQLIYHPVHGGAAPAPDLPQLGIFKGHRGILRQPAVALMVALHAYDDQLLSGALHVVVHAPGFAEGRVLVKENVMPVEHVHDGIPPVGFFVVAFRKIDVRSAGGIPGQLGDGHIPFDNHLSFPPIMKPSFIAY